MRGHRGAFFWSGRLEDILELAQKTLCVTVSVVGDLRAIILGKCLVGGDTLSLLFGASNSTSARNVAAKLRAGVVLFDRLVDLLHEPISLVNHDHLHETLLELALSVELEGVLRDVLPMLDVAGATWVGHHVLADCF